MIKYFCDVCNKELSGVDLHAYQKGDVFVELCREHFSQITSGKEALYQKQRLEKETLWETTFAVAVKPAVEPVEEPVAEPAVEPEVPPVEGGV